MCVITLRVAKTSRGTQHFLYGFVVVKVDVKESLQQCGFAVPLRSSMDWAFTAPVNPFSWTRQPLAGHRKDLGQAMSDMQCIGISGVRARMFTAKCA